MFPGSSKYRLWQSRFIDLLRLIVGKTDRKKRIDFFFSIIYGKDENFATAALTAVCPSR